MPQLTVYPHPKRAVRTKFGLARDGWNHETYWAGSVGLENLKERTIGRWPAGNRRWSSKYMGSQLHWPEDHTVHRSLALWHSGSQIPWNLTLSPPFPEQLWVGLSFWEPNNTTYKHQPDVPFMVLQDQILLTRPQSWGWKWKEPPHPIPHMRAWLLIRDVSRSHGFLGERWTLPENIQKQPSEKLSE